MLSIFQTDDLNGLKAFLASGYNEKDLHKEIPADAPKILLHLPPLVSVAVFYGSFKCAVYMIRERYDLFTADSVPFIFFFKFSKNHLNHFLNIIL